jgi:hypothetical protein
MTENRERMTEDRELNAECGNQRDGGLRTDDSGRKTEGRRRMAENG